MNPDRHTLDAFVDGELPAHEMESIAAILESRPDLNRYVREQEQLRASLKNAFSNTIALPASPRLIRTVQTAPISWKWRLRSLLRNSNSPRLLLPVGSALAMGVALGLLLRPTSYISLSQSGNLVAKGSLSIALNTQLASRGYSGKGPRIGISFRNKAEDDCRTFSLNSTSGLACYQSGTWVISLLVKDTPEAPGSAYQMAGSGMPEALRQAVRQSIKGSPFDAAAEKLARARGWVTRKKTERK
jgi:hypothetical protein